MTCDLSTALGGVVRGDSKNLIRNTPWFTRKRDLVAVELLESLAGNIGMFSERDLRHRHDRSPSRILELPEIYKLRGLALSIAAIAKRRGSREDS